MAKVSLNFDTVTKKADTSIDDKPVENFKGLHLFHMGEGKYGMEMHTGSKDDEHDMHVHTRTVADDGSLTEFNGEPDYMDEEMREELRSFFGVDD